MHTHYNSLLKKFKRFDEFCNKYLPLQFLRKIPGGVFGPENERQLFQIIKSDTEEERKR